MPKEGFSIVVGRVSVKGGIEGGIEGGTEGGTEALGDSIASLRDVLKEV